MHDQRAIVGTQRRNPGQRKSTCCHARRATCLDLGRALQSLVGNGGGNLAVKHIDHTAHGARAVEQGRWAAQHFHLGCQQGLGRDRMVRADRGGIQQLGAIAEHRDTRAIHAANHGTAGTGTEMAGVDAGLCCQGFAQRGSTAQAQLLLAQHLHGRGHIAGGHAGGRDSDLAESGLGSRRFLRMDGRHCSQQGRNKQS